METGIGLRMHEAVSLVSWVLSNGGGCVKLPCPLCCKLKFLDETLATFNWFICCTLILFYFQITRSFSRTFTKWPPSGKTSVSIWRCHTAESKGSVGEMEWWRDASHQCWLRGWRERLLLQLNDWCLLFRCLELISEYWPWTSTKIDKVSKTSRFVL